MKRLFTLLCCMALLFSFVCSFSACKGDDDNSNTEAPHMLDGKKIIFIGDSFVFYGQTVLEKSQSVLSDGKRTNDHGYFYQLCKAMARRYRSPTSPSAATGLPHFAAKRATPKNPVRVSTIFPILRIATTIT